MKNRRRSLKPQIFHHLQAGGKPIIQNKKGLDYYVPTLTIMGLFLLGFVVFSLFTKDYHLRSGLTLGTEQFRILKAYTSADKALLFVDDSARLALEQAAFDYGRNGFYGSASPCGNSGDYLFWAKDSILEADGCVPKRLDCYPGEGTVKETFLNLFQERFSSLLSVFNSKSDVKVPLGYEPFRLSGSVAGTTEVVGIPKEPVTVSLPNLKYEAKPGFRESISPDVIFDANSIVAVARTFPDLDENEIRSAVSSVDGQNGLDWDENFPPPKKSGSCQYASGSCSCCGTEKVCKEYEYDELGDPVLDKDGEFVCKKEGEKEVPAGEGAEYTTLPYDAFEVLMGIAVNDPSSVTGHKRFFVYDGSGAASLEELRYSFGLNWIESHPGQATTECVCGSGHPCAKGASGGGED